MTTQLAALLAGARDAIDGARASDEEFARFVAHHAESGAPPAAEHAADLGLAFACARGAPGAIEALDRLLTAKVAQAVRRVDPSPAFADVVAQDLRTQLLVGERPRIAEYAGRGPLGGWLRTAALRIALNLRRAKGDARHDSLSSAIAGAAELADVAVLRAKYQGAFEGAMRTALERLPARERAILCMNVRDGMSCDKLAALYKVGRSTAKRWLASARETLAAETRREIHARLDLTPSELESVAAVLCSGLDVSVARLLQIS